MLPESGKEHSGLILPWALVNRKRWKGDEMAQGRVIAAVHQFERR